ncbi:MAG: prolyl oligopeptidase family serine peptidase [Bacteroidetes bacterium]|nr:prolyl oligopeptidase family serine peptidase [Bacteroidota bacterium]
MKKIVGLFSFILLSYSVISQENKKPLTFDDIIKWNRITQQQISHDGNIVAYKTEPWEGNSQLKAVKNDGTELLSVNGGTKFDIMNDSKFVVFEIETDKETLRELKLKNTEKEDLPKSKLGIFNTETNVLDTIPNLQSFKVPKKWSGWVAYQIKTTEKDTTIKKEENDENGYTVVIRNLENNREKSFPFVTEYVLSKDHSAISFISTGDDQDFKPGVYFIDLINSDLQEVFTAKGTYKALTFKNNASSLAFIADTSDNKKDDYGIYLWNRGQQAQQIVTNQSKGISENWEIPPNSTLQFADKENRLFFGTAPIKAEKDTTILDEEVPKLDIWHWNEPVLHSQQLNTLEQDLKKSYLAVYLMDNKKVVQLENTDFTGIDLINKGDADKALAWSNKPYAIQFMWEGEPEHFDFYLIDIKTGNSTMIKRDCRAYPQISPEGKYIYWYNFEDTTWNTYNIETNTEHKITTPDVIQVADELNDMPNLPFAYGEAGWLTDDNSLLIYDRYDLWKVDPENKSKPVNFTKTGRQDKITYRIIDFKNDNRLLQGDDRVGFSNDEPIYLTGHNESSRADGYYKISLKKPNEPEALIEGEFKLNKPIKARDKDVFVYTRETFQEFPNLLLTKNEFKKSKKISNANPFQDNFLWGTKELYTWTSLDGQKLEGLLIKPANFDPNKKYPMIVNFYEKASQNLYDYQMPEAHRSTVDYHYYSSNGYIIFNPDVYYKEGYPGESAYNCVMPGVTQLISEGFVDKDRIAAQGHSWGGYQVAYLATRTNLFAAIESGAPVVNMFSAYGGIRLWTGRNRSFQYEHTQSRIGKTIWESPLRYLENSPLFTADKIQTPLLIMHNEGDGAVPFSQGIEFFIALRRMGKKAWLLNYNEADHWPTVVRDKYDFQIRMAQFFDHYLKNKPMPDWMKEGLPAVEKENSENYNIITD